MVSWIKPYSPIFSIKKGIEKYMWLFKRNLQVGQIWAFIFWHVSNCYSFAYPVHGCLCIHIGLDLHLPCFCCNMFWRGNIKKNLLFDGFTETTGCEWWAWDYGSTLGKFAQWLHTAASDQVARLTKFLIRHINYSRR